MRSNSAWAAAAILLLPIASRSQGSASVAERQTRAASSPAIAPDSAAEKHFAARAAERRKLEDLIDEHIKQERRAGRISPDERTAWSVYDFTTGEKLVEINEDIELQAASLIKPFLALAFLHQVSEGKLRYDAQSRERLEKMIQRSDNAAADWVMRRLGGPAEVQRLLRKNYSPMLEGVRITEYIPRDGRTYRNKASARDYSRFLFALWKEELPESKEIKRLLALPKRDRLRTGVPLPEDTEVYDKTGSTSRLCGDMGVLQAKGPDGRLYAYTMIGIIEKRRPARNYFRWLSSRGNVIREISALVYRGVGALHGFDEASPAATPSQPQVLAAATVSAPESATATAESLIYEPGADETCSESGYGFSPWDECQPDACVNPGPAANLTIARRMN